MKKIKRIKVAGIYDWLQFMWIQDIVSLSYGKAAMVSLIFRAIQGYRFSPLGLIELCCKGIYWVRL